MKDRLFGLEAAILGACDSDEPSNHGLKRLASNIGNAMEECAAAFEAERQRRRTPEQRERLRKAEDTGATRTAAQGRGKVGPRRNRMSPFIMSPFMEFLAVKLDEYRAQEAVAPSEETRERIALVRELLRSYRRREKGRARASGAPRALPSPGRLLH
jgi:hypothetical protein